MKANLEPGSESQGEAFTVRWNGRHLRLFVTVLVRIRPWLPLLIILVTGVVIPLTWYHPGRLLVSADFNDPFNPVQVFREVWKGWANNVGFGGGNTIALLPIEIPYFAILTLFELLGVPAALGELLTFSLIFSTAGVSMWLLLRHWFGNGAAAFAGGFIYMLNPFTLIEWHGGHGIELIGWGLCPLVLLLVDVAFTKQELGLAFWASVAAVALFLAAPASTIPSIIGFIIIPVLLLAFSRWSYYKTVEHSGWRVLRRLVAMFGLAVLMNLWWLLPTATGASIVHGFASQPNTATPPDMLVPMNAFNLITGWGYWGWHQGYQGAAYFTFESLYEGRLAQLLEVTPLLFGLSAFFRVGSGEWRTFRKFGAACVLVCLPLAASWHGPFGNAWDWAYVHIPGFVAFRSPWERFAGLEWLGIAGLVAAALSCGGTSVRRRVRNLLGWGGAALALVLMVAITLPIFGHLTLNRDSTGRLIYYSKKPPRYVSQFSASLAREPRCEILNPEWNYQTYIPLTWYRGGYPSIDYLLPCEIITAGMNPYNDAQSIANVVDEFIASHGNASVLVRFLGAIGITDVLVANDYAYSVYNFGPTPKILESYFSNAGLVEHKYGRWIDFRLPKSITRAGMFLADHPLSLHLSASDSPQSISNVFEKIASGNGGTVLTRGGVQLTAAGARLVWSRSRHAELLRLSGTAVIGAESSFDSGWTLSAQAIGVQSATLSVRHIEINGYANGWLVSGRGSYILTTSYGPSSLIVIGGVFTLLTIVGLLFLWVAVIFRWKPFRGREVALRKREPRV